MYRRTAYFFHPQAYKQKEELSAMENGRIRDQISEWRGHVAALYLARAAGAPMETITEAHLIAGRGMVGDRYYQRAGTHSGDEDDEPGYEITLIEQETIEAVRRERKIELDASAPRRNIVTHGCALNHLVHRTFRIGETILRGVALREPCANLLETTSHVLVVSLIHRGGLGARILRGGAIRVGDVIEDVQLEEHALSSGEL
jgi:MOSC domain-containing protein YiiM